MISDKDKQVIQALRGGCRRKLDELSNEINLPTSTFHDRMHKLLDAQDIRLVSLLNYKRLRLPLQSWIVVNAEDKLRAQQYLQGQPHVNTLLRVNNGANLLCEAIFSDFNEYYTFLDKLEAFGEVHDHPILEHVSQEQLRVAT